jgi:polyisoprenoid-binding protein YceI
MSTPTATPMIGTYNADPVHSSLGFSIPYQGVSVFRGTLTEVDAKLVDGRLEGKAPVESISITTPETFRAHVLSAEFFDVKAHPEVKFVSTALDVQEDGRARVSGDLTIKGVIKPFTQPEPGPHPPPTRSATPARTSLSRRSSTARSGA